MKNCLNCRNFSACTDPYKSGTHSCGGWKKFKIKHVETLEDIFSMSSGVSALSGDNVEDHRDYNGFQSSNNKDGEKNYHSHEVNLNKMMDEVFGDKSSPWPKDMKIDDGDFPEFANIYDFFFDRNYGLVRNTKPFSRQLWIGMTLFADFCPRCSDKKFIADIENVDVKMKAVDFPDRVQFLKFGICPKCKARKSDMVKKGELNYYRELAAIIGQRAGKSITVSFLVVYLLHKYLKMQRPAELLTGLNNVTLRGTFTATDFKTANETLWEPICDTINESPWYCIAEGSLISLVDGNTKEIQDVVVGDVVKTHDSSHEVLTVINSGIKECFDVTLSDGKTISATEEHRVGCLSEDGKSIVWKKVKDITDNDFVIVETSD